MIAKFNYIVCSTEASKDDVLSIDELQGSLLVHEQKLNQQEKDEVALKAVMSSKGRDPKKDKWKGKKYHQKGEKNKVARKEDAEIKEEEEKVSLLIVSTSKEEVPMNLWYLDTGCSNHMCGKKEEE
ncbi:hypothetical protein T459_32597 [Capsicum annuum]|uniref:Retrovirus-related Pol polyprotein from transposon TNT 1-94 n=1 Tax=Capsicum annuum TaxID=4072 RepID=A0A2G2Y1C1_CAPAN|nr:hypothetical protein T459_32597 [Capsicum annuum]